MEIEQNVEFTRFFLKVHDIVIRTGETADSELTGNVNTMIHKPWLRQFYRTIIN